MLAVENFGVLKEIGLPHPKTYMIQEPTSFDACSGKYIKNLKGASMSNPNKMGSNNEEEMQLMERQVSNQARKKLRLSLREGGLAYVPRDHSRWRESQ